MNRIVMLLLVGSALLVGACGSSGKTETETAASSAPAPASETQTATPKSTDWPDASTEKAKSKDSGAATKSSGGSGGGASPKAVAIKNFAFGPSAETVKVGQKVTWTNDDDAPHTVTGGELDS